MKIKKYLSQHLIVGSFLPDFVCIDAIVDDPEAFIRLVTANNCYVTEIIMWDRVKIGAGSKIGYGGPPDPRAASEYYFSETILTRTFRDTETDSAYIHFISESMAQYPDSDLFPSFTVVHR